MLKTILVHTIGNEYDLLIKARQLCCKFNEPIVTNIESTNNIILYVEVYIHNNVVTGQSLADLVGILK